MRRPQRLVGRRQRVREVDRDEAGRDADVCRLSSIAILLSGASTMTSIPAASSVAATSWSFRIDRPPAIRTPRMWIPGSVPGPPASACDLPDELVDGGLRRQRRARGNARHRREHVLDGRGRIEVPVAPGDAVAWDVVRPDGRLLGRHVDGRHPVRDRVAVDSSTARGDEADLGFVDGAAVVDDSNGERREVRRVRRPHLLRISGDILEPDDLREAVDRAPAPCRCRRAPCTSPGRTRPPRRRSGSR